MSRLRLTGQGMKERYRYLSERQKEVVKQWQRGVETVELVSFATYERWSQHDAESWIEFARGIGADNVHIKLSEVVDLGEVILVPTKDLREAVEELKDLDVEVISTRIGRAVGDRCVSVPYLLGSKVKKIEGGLTRAPLLISSEKAIKIARELGIEPRRIGV